MRLEVQCGGAWGSKFVPPDQREAHVNGVNRGCSGEFTVVSGNSQSARDTEETRGLLDVVEDLRELIYRFTAPKAFSGRKRYRCRVGELLFVLSQPGDLGDGAACCKREIPRRFRGWARVQDETPAMRLRPRTLRAESAGLCHLRGGGPIDGYSAGWCSGCRDHPHGAQMAGTEWVGVSKRMLSMRLDLFPASTTSIVINMT